MTKVKLTNKSRDWSPEFDFAEPRWRDWDSSQLPDGAVAQWIDKAGGVTASQSTPANRPSMSAAGGGVVFSSGTQNLTFPNQGDVTRYHRAVVILCKANVTGAANSDGSFFAANGFSGSSDNRAPYLGYVKGTPNVLQAAWAVGAGGFSSNIQSLSWPDDTNWHVIVTRRVNGVHKLSIDGGTEVTDGANVLVPRNVSGQAGIIGDLRTSTIAWTCARILVLQNELSDADLARIQGWALWSKGAQAQLPGGHAYASAAPKTARWANPYPIITDAAFQTAMIDSLWATDNTKFKQNYSNSIAAFSSGFTQDFLEDFTALSAVTDETGAPGGTATFFSPSIDDTGGSETPRMPSQSPAVFSQAGSELIITMQQSASVWYSSSICSVNLDGRGYTFDPSKAPFYVEYKVRMGLGNSKGLWTALWMKPVSEFFNGTTGHFEWDLCETYNSEAAGVNQHVTLHSWPALRAYENRNSLHQFSGKDFALDAGHSWPGAPVSLYDNTTHTIAYFISKTLTGTSGGPGFIVAALDGLELGRWPLLANMLQPHYLIASFNQIPAEAAQASGTYTMAIDSIKVLKGNSY